MSRYHTLDTHTGVIVKESNYLPDARTSPRKRSYTKTRPDIHLSYKEAWVAGMLIFSLGVWFAL